MAKKLFWVLGIFGLCLLVSSYSAVFAQEEGAGTDTSMESGTDWKQEIKSDMDAFKAERDAIKESASEAIGQEKDLLRQIGDAKQAGDFETAKNLRDKLHALHQQNMEQRQQDMQGLKESRQELKGDIKEAREAGVLPPPPRGIGDRREDFRDRREDIRDRREDVVDRKEDIRDRKEDVRDRREDVWDATHNAPKGTEAWRRDKAEDVRDRNEDRFDRREDKFDKREDVRDRREDRFDKRENVRDSKNFPGQKPGNQPKIGQGPSGNRGVRDYGQGVGAGKGQGGMQRSSAGGPKVGGGRGVKSR